MVLCLLWCNAGLAEDKEDVKLPKDVASGNKYFKSMTTNYKEYGMQVVNKNDGHPVRAGNQSIRFEVRPGDCGHNENWNDCENDRERHELSGRRTMSKGEWWYAWSIYFPKDYVNVYPTKVALGQFHQKKGHPVFMFDFLNFGYYVVETTREDDRLYTQNKIVKTDEAMGKWNDVLVNMKWTKKDDGFFKVWINNELRYDYNGPTKTEKKVFFKFGIYRTFLSKYIKYQKITGNNINEVPTQVVYFDEVRMGKSKKKVVGNLPQLQ